MCICVASFSPLLAHRVCYFILFGVCFFFFFSLTVCKLLLLGEKRKKAQLFRHDFWAVLDLFISSLHEPFPVSTGTGACFLVSCQLSSTTN